MTLTEARRALLLNARERFDAKLERRDQDECWPWKGTHTKAGYGTIYIGTGRGDRSSEYAHRLALFYDTRVWGKVARHSCDNPGCCNPLHLSWGSMRDNSQDALTRRRAYVGSANSNAVLTETIVLEARELRAKGFTYRALGRRYEVQWKTIWNAINHGWQHV